MFPRKIKSMESIKWRFYYSNHCINDFKLPILVARITSLLLRCSIFRLFLLSMSKQKRYKKSSRKLSHLANVNINVWCQIKENKSWTAHFTLFFVSFFTSISKIKKFFSESIRYIKRFGALLSTCIIKSLSRESINFFAAPFCLLLRYRRILLTPSQRLRSRKKRIREKKI